MIHLLITTRDYPYTNLKSFSLHDVPSLDSFVRDRYSEILSDDDKKHLEQKNEDWANRINASNDEKNKELQRKLTWKTIDIVFKHERADWTQDEAFFKEKKKKGIPVAILACESVKIYLLPCTAVGGLSLDFRQQYTAMCIEVICSIAGISKTDLYSIIHSGDLYDDSNSKKNGLIGNDGISSNSSLSELAQMNHVYHFHHESGNQDNIYDAVIKPATFGNKDKISKELIDHFFTEAKEEEEWKMKIWETMNRLNRGTPTNHEAY